MSSRALCTLELQVSFAGVGGSWQVPGMRDQTRAGGNEAWLGGLFRALPRTANRRAAGKSVERNQFSLSYSQIEWFGGRGQGVRAYWPQTALLLTCCAARNANIIYWYFDHATVLFFLQSFKKIMYLCQGFLALNCQCVNLIFSTETVFLLASPTA